MGMRLFGSSCGASTVTQKGDPNPAKFKIVNSAAVGNLLVAKVYYPDCTTHDGMKIGIWHTTPQAFRSLTWIDPHFLDGDSRSPIARFPGDAKGWDDAVAFAQLVYKRYF